MHNLWFQTFNPKLGSGAELPQSRLKLYAFHFAGASCQYFQPWANKLPSWIELVGVQLPGRWNRIQEPAFLRMEQLTPVLGEVFIKELQESAGNPYAFYGHSLGGLVAYDLIRFLTIKALQLPVHIFISSKRAVNLPYTGLTIYHLPDAEFEKTITYLYGGLPPEIASEPDMKKLFLDITKKDMELLDTYTFNAEPLINVPMTVLGGTDDHVVTIKELQPWQELSSATVELQQFPGGHFFLRDPESEPKVIDIIVKNLEQYKTI
jgi:medium-chain acyl-[acyl-carrier-protein] hydrolase